MPDRRPEPRGLGTTVDVIEKLIAGNEKAMLAWDGAVQGETGAPVGNRNAAKAKDETTDNNVNGCAEAPERPVGNSAQAGLRRLRHAAESGDEQAADLLRRVIDPNDGMTVNGACVVMGWRPRTRTVIDTDDGMASAAVKRLGPVETVRQAWRRASVEEREEIAAWVDQQMSPLKGSRFG